VLEAIENICKLLSTRRAALFLGAGINVGLRSCKGEEFPLGEGLAKLICRDLLNDELLQLTLDEAAEYARTRFGLRAVNKYLFEFFSGFAPGQSHLTTVKLPWDVIYTTNFDMLLEQAAAQAGKEAFGPIKPIVSFETDVSELSEEDTPYYKLHGSIDLANTKEGRLTLTKEDYAHYIKIRRPLFKRLVTDLTNRTCVFVGYSMLDYNFRDILEECRQALDTRFLPESYAIRPGFRDAEAEFWLEKYNVHLVDATAEKFLETLAETWFAEGHVVIPLEKREAMETFEADPSTKFPKIADCFFQVLPEACTGLAEPKRFFFGGEPTWADIRDGIAPPRTLYWTIFESMFDELVNPKSKPNAYLITGHAGTGKTTLLRALAYTLAKEFGLTVLIHIGGTPLRASDLRSIVKGKADKRIILLVHDAAEYPRELRQLHLDAIQLKLPLTVLLEDRTNQWNVVAGGIRSDFNPDVFELGSLSKEEIIDILDALEKHDSLGQLASADRGQQIAHFANVADKDLLVALRELTMGARFDQIIQDEYNKVPGFLARKAYAYAAALGQIDLYIRNETLLRLLNCSVSELAEAVFKPTEGVLISSQVIGRSRHTIGYKVRPRHPVIASVVFSTAASDDAQKLEVINSILSALDPGYHEDRYLLNAMVSRRELVKTLASPENQRGVYDRLAQLLPENAFVYQHRSILERELGDIEKSLDFAYEAKKIEPHNAAVDNTLGLALEMAARSERQPMRRQAFLREATSLFESGISSDKENPFGYLGKVYVLRQQMNEEPSADRRMVLQAEILSVLETGSEETDESPVLQGEMAKEQKSLGEISDAIATLEATLNRQPSNERIANLLIQFLIQQSQKDKTLRASNLAKAKEVANKGIAHSPNSWRLHKHMARLLVEQGVAHDIVTEHYRAAIRSNQKEVSLYVEMAAYLFKEGDHEGAKKVFMQADQLPINSQAKHKIYHWFVDERGYRRKFAGKVSQIAGAGGFVIAVPENFQAYFWRRTGDTASLAKGDSVGFYVGFNCRGAVAKIIEVVKAK